MNAYSITAPEEIAKKYGGNKKKIQQAAAQGLINPTEAVMAGMFIDRIRNAAAQEQAQQPTVAEQVMNPQPQMPPQGMAAMPQAQQMPQQAQMGAPQAPQMQQPQGMAMGGGLDSIDYVEGDYAEGGIVSFAPGGAMTKQQLLSQLNQAYMAAGNAQERAQIKAQIDNITKMGTVTSPGGQAVTDSRLNQDASFTGAAPLAETNLFDQLKNAEPAAVPGEAARQARIAASTPATITPATIRADSVIENEYLSRTGEDPYMVAANKQKPSSQAEAEIAERVGSNTLYGGKGLARGDGGREGNIYEGVSFSGMADALSNTAIGKGIASMINPAETTNEVPVDRSGQRVNFGGQGVNMPGIAAETGDRGGFSLADIYNEYAPRIKRSIVGAPGTEMPDPEGMLITGLSGRDSADVNAYQSGTGDVPGPGPLEDATAAAASAVPTPQGLAAVATPMTDKQAIGALGERKGTGGVDNLIADQVEQAQKDSAVIAGTDDTTTDTTAKGDVDKTAAGEDANIIDPFSEEAAKTEAGSFLKQVSDIMAPADKGEFRKEMEDIVKNRDKRLKAAKKEAFSMALLQAGLGMLGQQGGQTALQALGKAALPATKQYASAIKEAKKEDQDLLKLGLAMEQMDAKELAATKRTVAQIYGQRANALLNAAVSTANNVRTTQTSLKVGQLSAAARQDQARATNLLTSATKLISAQSPAMARIESIQGKLTDVYDTVYTNSTDGMRLKSLRNKLADDPDDKELAAQVDNLQAQLDADYQKRTKGLRGTLDKAETYLNQIQNQIASVGAADIANYRIK